MHTRARKRRWSITVILMGIGLAGMVFLPAEGRTDPGWGQSFSHHREHKRDFASRTFHALLHDQKDLNLSAEQVGKIESLAADYAKTRIQNRAAVELAEVDVRSLIKNPQSDLSAIEAALQKSEGAKTSERLDRVKAIRTVLAVLTAEQRDAWRTKMHERHGEGHRGRTCGTEPGHDEHALNHDDGVDGAVAPDETVLLSDDGETEPSERLVASTECQ